MTNYIEIDGVKCKIVREFKHNCLITKQTCLLKIMYLNQGKAEEKTLHKKAFKHSNHGEVIYSDEGLLQIADDINSGFDLIDQKWIIHYLQKNISVNDILDNYSPESYEKDLAFQSIKRNARLIITKNLEIEQLTFQIKKLKNENKELKEKYDIS